MCRPHEHEADAQAERQLRLPTRTTAKTGAAGFDTHPTAEYHGREASQT